MTTRRFRPPDPPRGRIGRFGPLRPSAIDVQSRTRELTPPSRAPRRPEISSATATTSTFLDRFDLTRTSSAATTSSSSSIRSISATASTTLVRPRRARRPSSALPAVHELLMRGNAAVPRAGQRGVRTALPVRENRGAATGVLLAVLGSGIRGLGLRLRELLLGLDVDLPAREPGRESGIQTLLADRERELVVRERSTVASRVSSSM